MPSLHWSAPPAGDRIDDQVRSLAPRAIALIEHARFRIVGVVHIQAPASQSFPVGIPRLKVARESLPKDYLLRPAPMLPLPL